MTSEERISFHILENALDYVLSAAEYAKFRSPRSWKYSILHLVAGIELLLKARLQNEHWSRNTEANGVILQMSESTILTSAIMTCAPCLNNKVENIKVIWLALEQSFKKLLSNLRGVRIDKLCVGGGIVIVVNMIRS